MQLRVLFDQGGGFLASLPNRRHKAISAPGKGFDVTLFGTVSESLSQLRDVVFEIALFHEGVRPQFLHEHFLPKNMPAIFDERQEGVEHFWGERHGFPLAQKQPFPLVDAKLAELVEVLDPLDHTPPSQIPDNFLTAPFRTSRHNSKYRRAWSPNLSNLTAGVRGDQTMNHLFKLALGTITFSAAVVWAQADPGTVLQIETQDLVW